MTFTKQRWKMRCGQNQPPSQRHSREGGRRKTESELPKANCQMLLNDKFREECGVVAIYAHPEAEKLAYLGLHALQHRGQESAGIVTSDGMSLHTHKGMGL